MFLNLKYSSRLIVRTAGAFSDFILRKKPVLVGAVLANPPLPPLERGLNVLINACHTGKALSAKPQTVFLAVLWSHFILTRLQLVKITATAPAPALAL